MKDLTGWMRILPIAGDYPLPDSYETYLQQTSLIDAVVMPHGGRIQADGSLSIQAVRTSTAFAQAMPALAREAGQRYSVSVSAQSAADLVTFLGNSSLWQNTADAIVSRALTRVLDATWDGVLYDVLWTVSHISEHESFIELLANTVHAANLSFEVAFRAIDSDHPSSPDLSVFAQHADISMSYAYWANPTESTGPYDWTEDTIIHALAKGISPDKLILGVPLYSQYWVVTGGSTHHPTTHDRGWDLADGNPTWQDTEKEWYGTVGAGHVWIQDGNTVQYRLNLADEYGLRGAMLFTPGAGYGSVWIAVDDWKHPWPRGEFRVKNPDNKDSRTRESRDRYAVWLDD